VDDVALKWTLRDVVALELLAPWRRGREPMTAWSLRPAAVASLVNEVDLNDRRTVLELGAGASTLLLGRKLAACGGRVVAAESDAGYAARLQRWAGAEALPVTVVHAPLVPPAGRADGSGTPWYELAPVRAALAGAPADVLVVDGPPGVTGPLARRPAAGLAADAALVAPGATILVDDVDRPDEQALLDDLRRARPGHVWHRVDGTFAVGRPADALGGEL